MAKVNCDICEREITNIICQENDGRKTCIPCHRGLQDVAFMDVTAPEVIVWSGKVAKMGKDADGSQRTVIIIPKSQRLFFDNKANYSFIARKL